MASGLGVVIDKTNAVGVQDWGDNKGMMTIRAGEVISLCQVQRAV